MLGLETIRKDSRIDRARYWLKVVTSRIRTDLDQFSALEISALMCQGYDEIGTAIERDHPEWIVNKVPAHFAATVKDTDIAWDTLDEHTLMRHADYLDASGSRSMLYRFVRRSIASLRRSPTFDISELEKLEAEGRAFFEAVRPEHDTAQHEPD